MEAIAISGLIFRARLITDVGLLTRSNSGEMKNTHPKIPVIIKYVTAIENDTFLKIITRKEVNPIMNRERVVITNNIIK